jgi:NAD(P)-dependent dehydrogenase (short-subunit alcohol dehydrogenase family)
MHDLTGRTALVVGGSSGIGRAAAAAFASRGADVIVAGRSAQRLTDAAAKLEGGAGRVRTLRFDMTRDAEVDAAVVELPAEGVDWLVVTAATVTHGPFVEQPVAQVQSMFESKFWGAYRVARSVAPRMREGGAIVLVSGVLSRRPGANCAAVGAACAALEALARGLALELGPKLRANCIAPGMVETELHHHVPEERRREMFRSTGASLPVGRIGRPEEVAEAIVLVATNGYLTGQTIDVDGGHTIRQYATR